MERDNIGDGPIEMPFANLAAKADGIETQGMGWWTTDTEDVDNDVRENHMFSNITAEIAGHKVILILTGWSHLEGFGVRLTSSGYDEVPFPSSEIRALFDTANISKSFPKGLTHYIEQRIELDKATLANETRDSWRRKLETAIKDRENYLDVIKRIGELRSTSSLWRLTSGGAHLTLG